jgi:hypothetical protein
MTEKFTICLNVSKVDGEESCASTPICKVPNCSMSSEAVAVNERCAVLAAGTGVSPEDGLRVTPGANGNALKDVNASSHELFVWSGTFNGDLADGGLYTMTPVGRRPGLDLVYNNRR